MPSIGNFKLMANCTKNNIIEPVISNSTYQIVSPLAAIRLWVCPNPATRYFNFTLIIILINDLGELYMCDSEIFIEIITGGYFIGNYALNTSTGEGLLNIYYNTTGNKSLLVSVNGILESIEFSVYSELIEFDIFNNLPGIFFRPYEINQNFGIIVGVYDYMLGNLIDIANNPNPYPIQLLLFDDLWNPTNGLKGVTSLNTSNGTAIFWNLTFDYPGIYIIQANSFFQGEALAAWTGYFEIWSLENLVVESVNTISSYFTLDIYVYPMANYGFNFTDNFTRNVNTTLYCINCSIYGNTTGIIQDGIGIFSVFFISDGTNIVNITTDSPNVVFESLTITVIKSVIVVSSPIIVFNI